MDAVIVPGGNVAELVGGSRAQRSEEPRAATAEALWGGPRVALAAILALRGGAPPGRRRLRAAVPALQPGRAEHRPARVAHGARRRPRPALVRLPVAPDVRARAVPGVAGRAVLPRGAHRGDRAGARRRWPRPGGSGAARTAGLAGAVAAAAVAVETTHVAYSRMAVTDVPLTLGVAVALALLVSGRIELAGVAAGSRRASSTRASSCSSRSSSPAGGSWRRLAVGLVGARLAFARRARTSSSHFGTALGDAYRVQTVARQGWLGFEHDHSLRSRSSTASGRGSAPRCSSASLGLVVAIVRRAGTT